MDVLNTEIQLAQARMVQYQTNHILHVILSLVTVGIWLPVWLFVTISNGIERGRLTRKIRKLANSTD